MNLTKKVMTVITALQDGKVKTSKVAHYTGLDLMTILHYKNGRSQVANMRLAQAQKIGQFYDEEVSRLES